MFVRGPVATIQTVLAGVARMCSAIADMSCDTDARTEGGTLGRRSTPSMPDSPCMLGAYWAGRIRGLSAPRTTGIGLAVGLRIAERIARVL